MSILTATTRVLEFQSVGDVEGATYVGRDDDEGFITTSVEVDVDTWDDLGRPAHITVTIKPGDTLNGAS